MDGMQWMTSAMRAARAQLDTATHNLANVSSDGYRRFDSHVELAAGGLVAREVPSSEQGALRHTGRALDVAILGPGSFRVGDHQTRSGAFVRDRFGYLSNDRGERLRDAHGRAIRVSGEVTIERDGTVRDGSRIAGRIPLAAGVSLQPGFLETANVNAIGETLAILTAQRAFETAQKTFSAIDETRQKTASEVARLK
jgi:flagellar basal-body rod protein FlgF